MNVVVQVFVLPNLLLREFGDLRARTDIGLDERHHDESAWQDREDEGEHREPAQPPSPPARGARRFACRNAGILAPEQHSGPNTHREEVWGTPPW
jgi:hypothetical protein